MKTLFKLNLFLSISALAGLGLIENNSPNITAAMLVSPLMGPVMSVTFGLIISDYKLVVRSNDKSQLIPSNNYLKKKSNKK